MYLHKFYRLKKPLHKKGGGLYTPNTTLRWYPLAG